MDLKQLTLKVMDHGAKIASVEQRSVGLEKLFSKHVNRHFQLTLFSIAQLVILIGGVIALFIKFGGS
jgi:hypothetical protein